MFMLHAFTHAVCDYVTPVPTQPDTAVQLAASVKSRESLFTGVLPAALS
jgi:hypothetical protein